MRDSLRPRTVDQSWLVHLFRCHRLNNHTPRRHLLFSDTKLFLRQVSSSRNHLQNLSKWTHLPQVLHLIEHVLETKPSLHELTNFSLRNFDLGLLHLLQKGIQVSHAQLSTREVGWDEEFQVLDSLS